MKKTLITNLTFGAALLLSSFAHAATMDTCNLYDVIANGSEADVCVGQIQGNDGGTVDSSTLINDLFEAEGSDRLTWSEVAYTDLGNDSEGLTATTTTSEGGTWEYLGTDLSPPFVIILKATDHFSAYLFKDSSLLADVEGEFLISIIKNKESPNLSHMSIYSALNSDGPGNGTFGNQVPLPAALWLFGPALLGFMGFRRKTKS